MNTNVNLAFFTLLIIGIAAALVYLALRSGRGYSVQDTKAHAERFADIIEEGHGGMTSFMWITFAAIFIWCIIYFWLHWEEFRTVFFG